MSESVFTAADLLLVPLIPSTLSVRTLEQLQAFLAAGPQPAPEVLAFFSMVDRRKTPAPGADGVAARDAPGVPGRRSPRRARSS